MSQGFHELFNDNKSGMIQNVAFLWGLCAVVEVEVSDLITQLSFFFFQNVNTAVAIISFF